MKSYEYRHGGVGLLNTELQILHAALKNIEPSWSEKFLAAWAPINKLDRTIRYEKRECETPEERETFLGHIATLRSLIRERFEAAGKPLKAP